MKPSLRTVLTGALIGSLAVALTLALLVALGVIPKAPYVASWQALAGGGWVSAAVLGGLAFIAIGTLWGLPMAAVPYPTVLKGMLIGLIPTLWGLVGWAAVMGQPIFAGGEPKGIGIALLMNVGIWGSLLGWYARRHTRALSA